MACSWFAWRGCRGRRDLFADHSRRRFRPNSLRWHEFGIQYAIEHRDSRTGHEHGCAGFLPADLKRTTRQIHRCLAITETQQNSSDKSCAGTRAAGEGGTSTALPDPDLKLRRTMHLQKVNVGLGRENLMTLERGTPAFKGNAAEIIDRNNRVRIAHPHSSQCEGDAIQVEFTHWQSTFVGVQRGGYRCRLKKRSSHVDADLAISLKLRNNQASGGFDGPSTSRTVAIAVCKETRKATNSVAAHLSFGTISVENTHAQFRVPLGRERQDQAITSNAETTIADPLDPVRIG